MAETNRQSNANGFYAPPGAPLPTQQPPLKEGNPPAMASYGQLYQYPPMPQVPYQIYQAQVHYNKNWAFAKDGLQATSVVLCIIGFALSLSVVSSYWRFGYSLILNLPLFIFALVWGLIELFLRIRRNFSRPTVHPGAHVAMSLIIWLAAAVIGGIECTLLVYSYAWARDCELYDYYDDCDDDYFGGRRETYTALAVFTCILWLVHFILFVAACIDTAKHNAAARSQVMVVPQPQPVWYPQQQQPPPPQQQPAPRARQSQPIPLQTRGTDFAPSSVHTESRAVSPVDQSPPVLPTRPTVTEYYSPNIGSGR